jgi:DNA-binding PadR family transcriptional regulator
VTDVSRELVAASSQPLVLSILAEGESYGYAIIRRVGELTDGRLQWNEGMLYPVLHKLEQEGEIMAEWKQPPGERRRKYYRLDRKGRAALVRHRENWSTVHGALSDLWKGMARV